MGAGWAPLAPLPPVPHARAQSLLWGPWPGCPLGMPVPAPGQATEQCQVQGTRHTPGSWHCPPQREPQGRHCHGDQCPWSTRGMVTSLTGKPTARRAGALRPPSCSAPLRGTALPFPLMWELPPLTGHPQPVLSEPQLRPCRLPRGPEGQGHAPPVPGFPRSRHKDQEVSATRIGPSRVAGAGPGAKQLLQSEATLSFATRGFISACRAEVGGSFSVGRFSSNRGSLFLSFFKAISFLQLI